MKIDKRKPQHWLLLAGFFAQALLGVLLRCVRRADARRRMIVFYGHKLNGNLLALYRYLVAHPECGLQATFLTMDRDYCNALRSDGIRTCWAAGFACAGLLQRASALVSDHGLHALQPWQRTYRWLGLLFFDVWHGFGFKGHDPADFRVLRRYDEIWVDSPLQAHFYLTQFGFQPAQVHATGYARTDRLVRRDEDAAAVRRALGLAAPGVGKIVLFAPTWKQDVATRTMYPFGLPADTFLRALSNVAQRTQSTVVMRAHLNTGMTATGAWPRVVWMPYGDYPDTEGMLLVSDVLVCDWSSIAMDWLLLDRPTIFLDVPAPFAHGHTLDGSHRYGELVVDLDGLGRVLERYLTDPEAYRKAHGEDAARVRAEVFGTCADGNAAARCIERLRTALGMRSAGASGGSACS